jgi:hypothetical protein
MKKIAYLLMIILALWSLAVSVNATEASRSIVLPIDRLIQTYAGLYPSTCFANFA